MVRPMIPSSIDAFARNTPVTLSAFGGTHQGRVRPINEDRFLVRADAGLFVVADGMGGHSHGDIASSAVVSELDAASLPKGTFGRIGAACGAIDRANGAIRDVARANGGLVIGSTAVVLLVTDLAFTVLWCGDSRAYRIREGYAERLTRDHSEAAHLLAQGSITQSEAENWPRTNAIVHAVGVSPRPHIDQTDGSLEGGDTFVLCSDGLTEHLRDEEIAALAVRDEPEGACRALIRLALERGGTDNVSAIVVRANAA